MAMVTTLPTHQESVSVKQYAGKPNTVSHLPDYTASFEFLVLMGVSREAQSIYLILKSPPAINLLSVNIIINLSLYVLESRKLSQSSCYQFLISQKYW